ncbi:MAG: RhuM family protein [Chitinophagales bacterium]
MQTSNSQFILFKTEDEKISVDVRFENETVWLTQDQIAMLFGVERSGITQHIKNIFSEGELQEESVSKKFLRTATDGKKYDTKHYNLDMIISLGYRVNSKVATQFRIWATKRLNEYIRKGFTMDDERLKNLGGGGYWKELLQRIRDIRASEKVFYRQVLDIYSTSMDYDPKAEVSVAFFKKVQNKIYLRQTPISFKR